jgi:hypothetical protein
MTPAFPVPGVNPVDLDADCWAQAAAFEVFDLSYGGLLDYLDARGIPRDPTYKADTLAALGWEG